jgi:small GTP-binding protein
MRFRKRWAIARGNFMVRKEYVVEEVAKMMNQLDHIRNIAIVAHVDHGKTTMTDSLVSRAGLISKDLAGEQRMMDFDEQEQARGITIKAANISLAFQYNGEDYLINLIDTPGHVDFGGHVTRAMRAVDGVVLVVDSVEGIMPQTETVLRQALKEKAKPTVIINSFSQPKAASSKLTRNSNSKLRPFLGPFRCPPNPVKNASKISENPCPSKFP